MNSKVRQALVFIALAAIAAALAFAVMGITELINCDYIET